MEICNALNNKAIKLLDEYNFQFHQNQSSRVFMKLSFYRNKLKISCFKNINKHIKYTKKKR